MTQPAAASYVTLSVAGQICALPVGCVHDVLRRQVFSPVALAPPEIAGCLNLRGQIVTALDLRRRLDLPPAPPDTEPQAVVTQDSGELFALLTDQVCDVVTPPPDAFEPTPPTLPVHWSRLSTGLFRLPGMLVVLLDLPRILALPGLRHGVAR